MAHREGIPRQPQATEQTTDELRFKMATPDLPTGVNAEASDVRARVDAMFQTADAGAFATMHKIYNEAKKLGPS